MISLSDLPTGALAHVSSYLASPLSCALFAAALNHRDVDSSTAITSSQWDALDFGHIEKELAAKLTDDDISALLTHIDAVNNIKKLRLTNCINITGVGLKPLRGSIMIQQIDLSLVGDHESPVLYPEPSLSCTKVLPILDSIIERGEECALKHVQFPKNWRFYERNVDSDFHAFLVRYNGMLGNRDRDRVICLECSRDLPANEIMRMDVAQRQWRDFAIAVNVGIVRTAWILNNALIVKRRFASAASPKEDAAVPIKSGVITVLIIMMMC
ncbi:hypothetical protein QTG54_016595 [Skeletonema marinoi]|uniref:Uncharacterized protein n=1 Tax=Skeletonema marinoi TaxID=267567 RepID=A0AAD8XRW2_9STRA|nr:hypothetical protein QTG54_016595 [Skeletonema marinoi]